MDNIVKMLWMQKIKRQRKRRRAVKTITGISPLTFKGYGKDLKNYRIYGNTETKTRSYSGSAPLSFSIVDGIVSNYRIYGNTESGESVGDRTENLFDKNDPSMIHLHTNIAAYDTWTKYDGDACVFRIPCKSNQTYTLSISSTTTLFRISVTSKDDIPTTDFPVSATRIIDTNNVNEYTFTTRNDSKYILFQPGKYDIEMTINTLIVNEGSTPLPYEPYGYCIPITNNSETANIYLDEPLTKSGDNVDYVDYAEQKRHNADGTSEDVTLPALPAQSSTNSLSIGTTVQPSSVAVDVDEVVSCGDKVTDSQNVNYGKYKIPVTLTADSAETTDIYLDEPLAKSGNNTDYIDYATQKRRNSDGTESSVTLPEIAVAAGTNTLTVGTEVQPSNIEITGKIKGVTA